MATIMTREILLMITWQCHGDHRGCYQRVCVACGRVFYAGRPEARYCRPACRQRAYRSRLQIRRNLT